MDPVSPARARVQRRVLLACSDAATRDRIEAALAGSSIELVAASDIDTALALLGRQSFTLVLVDRMLGDTDGLEIVRRVRAFSVESAYVAMLAQTMDGVELERGYCEGVDQYIPRDVSAAALLSRVQAAFKAIALRRASRRIPFPSDIVLVDLASGAHTARHLVGRLSAEIKLAHATSRGLAIVIVRVRSTAKGGTSADDESLIAALQAVQTALRPQQDWIACLHTAGRSHRIAVVMPDSPPSAIDALKQHVRNAFVFATSSALTDPELSFGQVILSVRAGDKLPTALGILAQAERHQHEDSSRLQPTANKPQAKDENSLRV